MITRILNSRLPLMVMNPVKVFDAGYLREIHASGALPVLDTQFLERDVILERVDMLSREDILFGLRMSEMDIDLVKELEKRETDNLDVLIMPEHESGEVSDYTVPGDTKLVLEVTRTDINEKIESISPHALVLKGNEAAGSVSGLSSFILMQWYLKNSSLPVFVQGGVGMHTAAGMFAAGVSGVVLDSQVLLSDEAPVSDNFKTLLRSLDGNDSTEITTGKGPIYRVFAKLGTKVVKELKQRALFLADEAEGDRQLYDEIENQVVSVADTDVQFVQSLFFLGQDGIFAKNFEKLGPGLNQMISEFFRNIGKSLDSVDSHDPVRPDSELAREHGTKYPVVQGPMANISDNSKFASAILEGGALPFMAVGSLPENLADTMLKDGADNLDNFGAGLVGIEAFNPCVDKHMEMVKKYKIPFALFAGGVPSQVSELEKAGIKTYLHTPSVSMFDNAVKGGCTRFIFEGGEAGGHVGSLSSLVLWEAAVEKLLENPEIDLSNLTLIFAGGISTCYASYFISGFASKLAEKGARIGLQVGTAYLFTREITETGSIKKQYQDIIAKETETVVVGKSVGLASRTAPTEFAQMMLDTEQEMIKNRESLEDRKRAFEKKNIGSLLIGAKGFLPDFKNPGEENYIHYEGEEHRKRGNFLVGDSLAFFSDTVTVQDIHSEYFDRKNFLYRNLNMLEAATSDRNMINDEIAIVGMGCTLPDADSPEALWENIMARKYSIREMPEDRFDRSLYYDPDKNAEDKTYTILAGTVDDYEFDHDRFGYTAEKAARLSRSQKMVLETAYKAVENAGYLLENDRLACDDPDRTSVVIATCLGNELGNDLQLKYFMPEIVSMMEKTEEYAELTESERQEVKAALLEGLEGENKGYDPVHGMLLNIEASRIARHLGIRGPNYVVDAACASSFAAFEAARGELLSGESDQVIVGGVNTHLAPESFIGFAKMGTLSANGSYPFDERADGFILGEGAVVFMLKRVKDAIRDRDNILGVVNSIGSSSDGKGKAIAAPNPAGQQLSIDRCFGQTLRKIEPEEIGFIEAHGTSTIVGDQAELSTLKTMYDGAVAGVSSIKSQVGHLLGAAGAAGMIKALLAINKGVLPPNGRFENLARSHDLSGSGLEIIAEGRPWETDGQPRRAGVSSYGFGGINYHVLLQQMTQEYEPVRRDIFRNTEYDFNDDRIVIAGMGTVVPGADNTREFARLVESGEKQLSEIPEDRFCNEIYAREDAKSFYHLPMVKAGVVKDFKFDNLKYKMPPKMVRSVERGQLFGLKAADEAINDSGLSSYLEKGNKTGVILGTIAGERQSKNIIRVRKHFIANIIKNCSNVDPDKRDRVAESLVDRIRDRIPENNGDTTPGLLSNIISGRIANQFGLNGANYVIDASCASAAMAIRNAVRDVAFKNLDFALAGGVDTNLFPAVLMAFKRLGLLSKGDCNFFDSRADGYVMGEGASMHVITTRRKAKECGMEIMGEFNTISVKSSVPDHLLSPSGPTFVSAINEGYRKTGIRKNELAYLDLFAFSNIFGDMVEKQVVDECFDHELYCGNAKPQFGYFRAANPSIALARLMLMNKARRIAPNHNYDPDYSTIDTSRVLKAPTSVVDVPKGRPLHLASNVNGIGGNHCHILVSTLPASLEREKPVAAEEKDETEVLRDYSYSADHQGQKLRMVALLSGQGAQRSGMMKELFDRDGHIRQIMEKGESLFFKHRGYSLLDMMFKDDAALNLTENTQPAVFLSSAALFDRLRQEGFSPDCFIGHSVGEYTALFCSGMLGFDDAMHLVIKRADLMKEAGDKNPGKIMVVFKNEKETGALIRESFISRIYITNKNSEKQTAVSGAEDEIEKFCDYLTEQNVFHKKLNLSGAFHTPLLQEASDKLRNYLDKIRLNETTYKRVISNTTASPYPERREEVKDLLAKQIVSPVEFIKSVENVYAQGRTHFVEIGPSRLLVNLLKNINIADYGSIVTVDAKKGEQKSLDDCMAYLKSCNAVFTAPPAAVPAAWAEPEKAESGAEEPAFAASSEDFESFKENNQSMIDKLMYKEYLRQKREAAIEAVEKFDFNIEKIVISGVSVGLPGKARKVFSDDNFDAILQGRNFIETISKEDQERITDKNITKLYKQPDGSARFVQITRTEDVIHLAGQLGYFDLTDEYGIKEHYDVSMALGIAAGIEALKDAGIPLTMQYKKVNKGAGVIPDGFALPEEMQEETGVIITSLFPNGETLISEMEKYFYEKLFLKPYEEFENIYYYLMENVKDLSVKEQITDWFFKAKARKKEDFTEYKFDRNFLTNACPLGSAHLARIIKAKGPNTLVSSACASTTQAVGIAEDWIRVGRCRRVLVVGGENATSEAQNQWIGSGFLALGAATIKKRVSEAAKPFDEERNGTILGSGAVGIVVENESSVKKRGMNGQAEILGTHMANSGFHTYNIDVNHMASEMKKFVSKVEKHHDLKKEDYADKLLFMSHETYTPARGGSADAEVKALETAFSDYLKDIRISNTKGFTGHTLGAAIEDVVMVKSLQKRQAPPIANLKNIPENFRHLNFSNTDRIDHEYGLHLAAGFGSHFAFLFVKRIQENAFENNPGYEQWLQRISGAANPKLKIIDNTLCLVADEAPKKVRPERPSYAPAPAAQKAEPAAEKKADTGKEKASGTGEKQPAAATDVAESVKEIIAAQTGYTTDMLEADLDLEADLGIDTVKQVEIFGNVATRFGFEVPEDLKLRDLNTISKLADYITSKVGPAQAAPAGEAGETESTDASEAPSSAGDVVDSVKEIIAEQTGYTTDMLEADLDLEADLGIDTVKQVEIFGNVATRFGFEVPEDLKLRDLNTILKLAEYITSKVGPAQAAPAREAGETESAGASEAPSSAGDVVDSVKEIIAEQTGYTTDMLEADLDLEADLGIDTVKQVEIFGNVATRFGFEVPEDLKLRDLNTILKLAEYIISKTGGPDDTPPTDGPGGKGPFEDAEDSLTDKTEPKIESEISRLVPQAVKVPLHKTEDFSFAGCKVVLTFDRKEIAEKAAGLIKQDGGTVIGLTDAESRGSFCDGVVEADFSSGETVFESMKNLVKEHPDMDGLIHLAPVSLFGNTGNGADESEDAVRTFFAVMKGVHETLERNSGFVACMSLNSVVFPYLDDALDVEPAFAGISGMMKSLAKEMSSVRFKMVDFECERLSDVTDEIVSRFLKEVGSGDSRVETGYRGTEKFALKLFVDPCDPPESSEPVVRENDTVLVTGGARGITYEILKQMVETYQTDLVIMGRSRIDKVDEVFLEDGLTESGIMQRLKPAMPGAKPLELKKEAGRIRHLVQSKKNIETLKSKGVKVTYLAADVTDGESVEKALEPFDRIDGVIHAAGVEESLPFSKKDTASFEKVFNTKVKGCRNVIQAVKDRGVRFHIGFSSVTAKFGNETQADYTAANDMLARMLQKEKNERNTVCKVMDWTAWEGAGMATDETVKKVLTDRGLKFLPLDEGVGFFMDEIRDARMSEVVISGLDYSFDRDGLLGIAPFLDSVEQETEKGRVFNRKLDITRDRFLLEHAMEDTPVFLGATGVETMAEAAMYDTDGSVFLSEVRNFEIPYGIKLLKKRPKKLMIHAEKKQGKTGARVYDCRITSLVENHMGKVVGEPKLHYIAECVFSDSRPGRKKVVIPEFTEADPDNEIPDLLYHPQRLFMDGPFRTITDVASFDGETLVTRICDRSEDEFFAYCSRPDFIVNVALLDGMFQTGGAFEFFTDSVVVLPYRIGSLNVYGKGARLREYLCMTTRTDSDDETDTFNMTLADENGICIMELVDFQMVKLHKLEDRYRIRNRIKINTRADL
ncbi:MAG: SDR family NAD(P)-dependent oxidoreductase [Thermodesulfobacteriota bacterium]